MNIKYRLFGTTQYLEIFRINREYEIDSHITNDFHLLVIQTLSIDKSKSYIIPR